MQPVRVPKPTRQSISWRTPGNVSSGSCDCSINTSIKNVDDYFVFVDHAHPVGLGKSTVDWTPAEKALIRSQLIALLGKAPGLILQAAACRKVALFRESSKRGSSLGHDGIEAIARTTAEGIAFAQPFFKETATSQKRTIVHELAHSADADHLVSASKRWVRFANAKISRLRTLKRFTATDRDFKKVVSGQWPSAYGTTSLSEALAEYVSADKCGQKGFKCDPLFRKTFGFGIPSPRRLRCLHHFKNGYVLYYARQYREAIQQLKRSVELDPSIATTHTLLADCYEYEKDYKMCLEEAQKAQSIFDSAGVPCSEIVRQALTRTQAFALERQNNYKEAIEHFTLLIQSGHPESRQIYRWHRARCHDKLGHLAQSAEDYYDYFYPADNEDDLTDQVLNSSLAFAILDAQIRKFPSGAHCYLERARLRTFIAHQTSSASLRQTHYKLALNDVIKSLSCADCDRPSSLLYQGELWLKLNDLVEARKAYQESLSLDPSIKAKVFHLRLLEHEGKNADQLREEYTVIITTLLNGGPSLNSPGDHDPNRFGDIG